MAGPSSGESPEQPANGEVRRRDQENAPAVETLDDEQSLADSEQTLSDSDQTLSDADQTSAERDQASADSDQAASDRDQAASDRDLAEGADACTHEVSRETRERGAREREDSAGGRLESASERDVSANARDVAALARDQAAAARDLAMARREAEHQRDGRASDGAEIVLRAADQRERAAEYRAEAAQHRDQAAADRDAAAGDREQGARDRQRALADHEALALALANTETDPLTGARTRGAGLADLEHEVDRCRRTASSLVLAYVDVVGLKRVNDTEGHDAGDALLERVATAIRRHIRTYDLIIRLGGDEFACAMSTITLPEAQARFAAIATELAEGSEGIRAGFAELTATETAAELIAEADAQVVGSRRSAS